MLMEFADEKVLDYMGHTSGRDADKAKEMGLTLAYTENGTPYYEEADVVIECKLTSKNDVGIEQILDNAPEEFVKNSPYTFYVGKVVGAWKKQ